MTRLARRLRASLALFAALLTAAAPLFAHAHLALRTQSGYGEVCTDRGLVRVPAGDVPQGEGGLAGALVHCALCVSAGGDQALAGGAATTIIADVVASLIIVTADRGVSVDPLHTPRPRGPPAAPVAIA